jgi:trehalose 6-phosphate synthase/phosphatase
MPGVKLRKLLEKSARKPGNEVVLISGRDKDAMERWFGDLDVGLVAEHGAWVKEKGEEWEAIDAVKSDWKKEIHPILEKWVDRTPGAFIEEKEFSLAWHYRRADSNLGELRAKELTKSLTSIAASLNLQVLEGSKVMEVKNSDIDKGRAAQRWVSRQDWDFILALGDDWTDEDTFKVLPTAAWSIKVGAGASVARFSLGCPNEAISLLTRMIDER